MKRIQFSLDPVLYWLLWLEPDLLNNGSETLVAYMRPYFQLIKLHLDFNFLELWVVFKRICGMLFETESEQNILISLMFMTLQEFSQNPKSGQNLARF